MKALILAGGRGKRLGSATEARNKCMMEVLGKPIIEYSLQCAAHDAVREIVIIVGYRAEEIINRYGNHFAGKRIRYAIQREQRGLVHAIDSARDALAGDDFMLMLGDELLIRPRHEEMLTLFEEQRLFGVCGVVAVEDRSLIRKTYAIIQGPDDEIYRLIEKPRNPMNKWMGTGNCVFKNKLLSYIDETPINQARGEKELPDLIQCAIDDGNIIKSFRICDVYVNVNSRTELAAAESCFAHM